MSTPGVFISYATTTRPAGRGASATTSPTASAAIEVIPVLVQRARMPDPSALPEGLRALTRHQAFELSDIRWTRDVDELVAQVFEELDHHAPPRRPQLGGGTGASAMVAAGGAGILLATLFTGPLAHHRAADAPEAQRFVFYAAERGLIWALAGAFVLAAAGIALRDDRAGALGWAIVGAGSGVIGGALGGASSCCSRTSR
jgi:hypothetical protein